MTMRAGCPLPLYVVAERAAYLAALRAADQEGPSPFVVVTAQAVARIQDRYSALIR